MAHVPIKLYSATESKSVSFHEVHVTDGARLEHKRICSKDDKEVPFKEVVKGFEVAPDEYVVLDKDQVKAAAGAIRPLDGVLALHTVRFHDEVRPTEGMAPGGRKPAKKKADQAVAVIEALAVDWDPERYTDCYRERLAPAEPKQPKPAPDLIEALEATLEQMGSGNGKRGGGRKGERIRAGQRS